jgi:hypothetical protein
VAAHRSALTGSDVRGAPLSQASKLGIKSTSPQCCSHKIIGLDDYSRTLPFKLRVSLDLRLDGERVGICLGLQESRKDAPLWMLDRFAQHRIAREVRRRSGNVRPRHL